MRRKSAFGEVSKKTIIIIGGGSVALILIIVLVAVLMLMLNPLKYGPVIPIKNISGEWNGKGSYEAAGGYWSFKPAGTWPAFAIQFPDINIRSRRSTVFKITLNCSTNLPCKIKGAWLRQLGTPDAAAYVINKPVDITAIGVPGYSTSETTSVIWDDTKVVDSVSVPTTRDTITLYQLQGFDWYKSTENVYLTLYIEYGSSPSPISQSELKIYSATVQAITKK